jgi:hypothetical protein
MAVEERIEQTEGGFGSGLRAKMRRNTVEESLASGRGGRRRDPTPPPPDAGPSASFARA